MKKTLLFLTIFGLTSALKAQDGKTLFMQNCSNCHAYKTSGDIVGPSLLGVTHAHSNTWIEMFIIDNEKLVKAKDIAATDVIAKYHNLSHPKFNKQLSVTQVKSIIAFLAGVE